MLSSEGKDEIEDILSVMFSEVVELVSAELTEIPRLLKKIINIKIETKLLFFITIRTSIVFVSKVSFGYL
jgi:hypothetical protein